MLLPSKLAIHKSIEALGFSRILFAIFIFKSVVIVINPLSKALSCKAFKHNPFLGFNLFISALFQGII